MAKVLMKGNEAIGEAAIRAGCLHFFGYPITPQSEVPEYLSKRLPEVDGKYIQAESEVAASNMIFGSAGVGIRVLTSSSSPGISLMAEGLSYIAACSLPVVVSTSCEPAQGWAASSRPRAITSRRSRAPATATSNSSCWPHPRSRRRWTW